MTRRMVRQTVIGRPSAQFLLATSVWQVGPKTQIPTRSLHDFIPPLQAELDELVGSAPNTGGLMQDVSMM